MYSGDKIDIDIEEYSLEEHLEIKCKNNEKYKHLYAAWTTDKDVYTNSLSAVPVNFPHYSRHEASHSLSIVNKIEMILGVQRIKRLSPTDTFLILESAFSHDLGMIIPEDLLKKEWKKSSFKRFLKKLSIDGYDEDIMKAANYLLEVQEKKLESNEKNRAWPVEVRDCVILITAEYFRKNHGSRSELWLKQSEQIVACINGNKFIPERIMNIVGKIATAHGRDFDDMLNNLEHIQNGIGVDKIHPRFIASLIRLGDLLDLDNGRFNDIFEKTSPSPESSKVHKEKHKSITHFLVSPERIEVSAICESDTVYRETRLWFDWLSDELKNLSSKWSDIVPIGFQGGPPSLGDIKLSIIGAGDITEQLNLRFNIDAVRAFELIEGNGIYKDELVFIRELLQNAMDATKIKIWKDIKNGQYDDVWGSLDSDFKGKILSEYDFSFPEQLPEKLKALYPIKINVNYEEAKEGIGENQYIFTIEDKGCGISLKDLRRMENAGGSWEQDDELQDFIESMPGWLQPTGSFGIGLHSVFLITDEMKIETKSEKEDGYNINFVSRRKNGYITVKRDKIVYNTGTKVTLKIKESKLEKMTEKQDCSFDYFATNYKKKRIISILEERVQEAIKNIDTLNVRLKLIDEEVIIKKDNVRNIVPYKYCGESEELKYYISYNEYEEYINEKEECVRNWDIKIQDKTYETIVNLRVDCGRLGYYNDDRLKIRFKEINCENKPEFKYDELFYIELDVKKGKAKEVLAVSRDMLNENIYKDYMQRLQKIIIPNALEHLYEELDSLIKQNPKYIYSEITKNVNSNFQLLRLRLAFKYFLNKEEEYMKEWGSDIDISYTGINTFNDIVKSNYIISGIDHNLTDSLQEKVNELKVNVVEKECIYIGSVYPEIGSYINSNFSKIKRVLVESDVRYLRHMELKKRKQQVQISGKNFYIICFTNEEEAKNVVKILFDVDYENRQRLPCIAYRNNNDNVLLYKNIIISKSIEDSDNNLELKDNPYLISPFKENCDQLIKSFDYNVDKVIDFLKKEHNFDELVEWIARNAIYKLDNEDYKRNVIETYTNLIVDYLELLKKEQTQIICPKEIIKDEMNSQLDEAAIYKVSSNEVK